jgi:hypothetical protein
MQPIVQCLLFGRGWACLLRQKNRAAAIIWNILGHAVNCNNGCMELHFLKQDHHRKSCFDAEFPICLFTVDWTHRHTLISDSGRWAQAGLHSSGSSLPNLDLTHLTIWALLFSFRPMLAWFFSFQMMGSHFTWLKSIYIESPFFKKCIESPILHCQDSFSYKHLIDRSILVETDGHNYMRYKVVEPPYHTISGRDRLDNFFPWFFFLIRKLSLTVRWHCN